MAAKAAPASSGVEMFNITPPTSLLWMISDATTFIATGHPRSRAAWAASSGVVAIRWAMTGRR